MNGCADTSRVSSVRCTLMWKGISLYQQRIGILSANYGMGASVSLFNSLIAFALVIGANSISRNISDTSLW